MILSFLQNIPLRMLTFKKAGIRTSLFVDTQTVNIENAVITGTDRVELYTEPYATGFSTNAIEAINPFIRAAEIARSAGLGLNAGHDLNLDNIAYFHKSSSYNFRTSLIFS